ncbi:MFS general substrate transporter [Schizophyllum commune H4-8]|nr:MFS general substrate transporter [Schizophyllum commune H4-8]KAI5890517.1 MFS general substrate transporter [Schizophyllum commune H4-8]
MAATMKGELVADAADDKPGSKCLAMEQLVVQSQSADSDAFNHDDQPMYGLYRRRFVGLVAMILLNIGAAAGWPWFGPISNETAARFGITLNQVTWLGNIVALIYLPVALVLPEFIQRIGFRNSCFVGALSLILSSWIRYAATADGLSPNEAYALLMFGQLFTSIAQPIFQVLGPKYSETWFDLKGRTTATMIIAVSNPIGGAIGQLLSPISDPATSVLILGILQTAVAPMVFLIQDKPPKPPTFAASHDTPSIITLLRVWAGLAPLERDCNRAGRADPYMTWRERIDFLIVVLVFGVLVAATNAWAILTSQYLEPQGYSSDTAGLMGACLLLTGLVAAIVTSPLFDRVFTHHLALTAKILVPSTAAAWLSLIWAIKPHDTGGLYAIMTIIGVTSLPMLPVALELGCELTRNAEGSSAIMWFMANLLGFVFIISEDALRAGPDADPPLNMHRATIFNGVFIFVTSALVLLLKGRQRRRQADETQGREQGPTSA